MEEQRIFKLVIDPGASEKRISELTADLTAAKIANQELDKSLKAGTITTEEFGKQSSANKRILMELTGELRAETKVLDLHTKQTNEAVGSNNQMRAQLSGLTQQYNALSKAERENVNVGGVLKTQIKGLSDELKVNESAIGDNRRSVGNYTGGILAAVDGTGLLATVTTKAKAAHEAYSATLTIVRKGLIGNVGALKLFKLALAATGIGLVVIALSGLVAFLTRTQEGIDFVSAKTKGLTTVLGVITDKLSDFGEIMFNAFSNPKEALKDLMAFLEGQVMNRLKSFAVIWDGIRNGDMKKLNNGLLQLTTGFEDVIGKTEAFGKELAIAAKNGEKVERETQRIRDAERDLNVERANSRKTIKALNLLAEDTSKSTAQRAEAARKALKIEEGLMGKQLKLQKEKLANIVFENGLTKSGTADLERQAEAEKELANIEMGSLELRTTLNNKLNTIRKEGIAQQAAASLKQLEDRKAQIEVEMMQYKEGTQARLDIQEQLIQQELLIQNKGAGLSLNQRKLNELKANAQILELRAEFYKKDAEKEMEYRGILGELNKKAESQITKDSFAEMEKRRKKAEEEAKAISDAQIAAAENTKQALAEIDQERIDIAIETMHALSSLVEIVAGRNEEAANFQRALAVFEIGISAAKAVMSGIEKAAAAGPFPANLLAIVSTVATTLGYVAQAKALLSEGSAPKAPKFKGARGGLLQGPSHASGGIRGTGSFAGIEVEGGEALINKKATAQFLPYLNSINMATGGAPLAPVTFGRVGGIMLPQVPSQLSMEQRFRAPISLPQPPAPIDYGRLASELAKVRIVTKVTDINTAQANVNYTQGRASVR